MIIANKPNRILSIDVLRGLVIVLMALDHVRDFFHDDAFLHNPTDLATTTPFLFFTRWITHFCAPIFIFLAGVSAYLSGTKKTIKAQQFFLIKRGIWLILIELTIVNFGWMFDPYFSQSILQVIWAIGATMVMLGLIIGLKQKLVLVIGVAIIGFHNLLDYLPAITQESSLYHVFHTSGFKAFAITNNYSIVTVYGLLPWFGIMCFGYGLAYIFRGDFEAALRKKILIRTGAFMLLAFVALRFINIYGDPNPYATQPSLLFTFLSFIDVSKYPPSLLYTLLMLGPALLFLAFFEHTKNFLSQKLQVFGSVPFYFYIIHIYAIHVLVIPLFFMQGYTVADIIQKPFWFRPANLGVGLTGVYFVWIMLIIALYPLCNRYKSFKATRKYWWLSYL